MAQTTRASKEKLRISWGKRWLDALNNYPQFPPGCIKLAATDPPFNIGLRYNGSYDDSQEPEEYLNMLRECFSEVQRVLAPDGGLFVVMGTRFQAETKLLLEDLGFHLRNTIVWHFTFGQAQKRRFTP